jgi:magnesium chelatase subunit D
MRPPGFPFPALVGLDSLKMALQLAAIDHRLSVLIRGDKGAGKSTAARGLVDILATGAPFINLPIGATDDRLLGGLDVEKALKGEPALKRGLLADAHGGVLYVDEVNLLPDHLADALLDAVASGVHVVEREGFSATEATDFVMVGSMNPEEGALRPQLLDRFALAVDVSAPMDPATRREVIERRLAYDADPAGFIAAWRAEQSRMARQLDEARTRLLDVILPGGILDLIAERIAGQNVRSLRADLAVVRGSRALAALQGSPAVEADHVEAVLPLALAHRATSRSRDPRQEPPIGDRGSGIRDQGSGIGDQGSGIGDEHRGGSTIAPAERVFAPLDLPSPRLVVDLSSPRAGTSADAPGGVARGVAIGARRTPEPRELDTRATLLHAATRSGVMHAATRNGVMHAATRNGVMHAVTRSGAAEILTDDLHERVRLPRAGVRYVFVVDSSGSHAVQDRMRLVKGAAGALLDSAHGRRDEVVLIACRGASASVVVEPTPVLAEVQRALEYLPTGGRTPLAHALELAAGYITDASVVVVLTDGHANVASVSDDPWADALAAAAAIACPSLVIDSEEGPRATGRPRALAQAMRATHARLSDLDETSILHVVRSLS